MKIGLARSTHSSDTSLMSRFHDELQKRLNASSPPPRVRKPQETHYNFKPEIDVSPGFAWLLGQGVSHLQPTHRGKSIYGVRPRPHRLNSEQSHAFAFISRHSPLTTTFSLRELKTTYRQLAKRMHPDAGGSAADFRHLHDCYNSLKMIFKRAP